MRLIPILIILLTTVLFLSGCDTTEINGNTCYYFPKIEFQDKVYDSFSQIDLKCLNESQIKEISLVYIRVCSYEKIFKKEIELNRNLSLEQRHEFIGNYSCDNQWNT